MSDIPAHKSIENSDSQMFEIPMNPSFMSRETATNSETYPHPIFSQNSETYTMQDAGLGDDDA